MLSVYIKEIRSFLSSLIAYVAIIVFLLAIGLFMWVFKSTGVLEQGYANLDTLFYMGPWVFMFLVSAITMRSFSEEKKSGTIETLTTRPLSDMAIIMGKYLAGLYYYTIHELGATPGNLDSGAIFGSYIGLLLLGSCFVAIGMFASSITDNQIVAFILSMFLCFFFFSAFDYLGAFDLFGRYDYIIEWLGINYHYQAISRGVLDTRDVLYFISFTALFIILAKTVFASRKW
jgi:ABC-2 type transport system permease protein